MANYTPTFEHIIIKGNKTSLLWIFSWLMAHTEDVQYDSMTGFLSFVQACYGDEETPLQKIIVECPHKGWDIVNQFGCSYTSILHR
jgi:hypothetical protein